MTQHQTWKTEGVSCCTNCIAIYSFFHLSEQVILHIVHCKPFVSFFFSLLKFWCVVEEQVQVFFILDCVLDQHCNWVWNSQSKRSAKLYLFPNICTGRIEEFELLKKKLFPLLIWCCWTRTQNCCNTANPISNFPATTFPTKWALKCNLTKCHCIALQVCSWKSASLHLPTAKLHLSQIIQRCLLFWTFYPEWFR